MYQLYWLTVTILKSNDEKSDGKKSNYKKKCRKKNRSLKEK